MPHVWHFGGLGSSHGPIGYPRSGSALELRGAPVEMNSTSMQLFAQPGGGDASGPSLESQFIAAELVARGATVSTVELSKALAKLNKALTVGNAAVIRRLVDDIRALISVVSDRLTAVSNLDAAFIDRALINDSVFQEIADLAIRQGLGGVRATEGRLFSYPYVVEKKKGALSIGSRQTKGVRPSHVLSELIELRKRATKEHGVKLLAAVEKAYQVIVRGQETGFVRIDTLYELLTALPGSEKELSLFDFVAALSRMVDTGENVTKNGKRLELPLAATGGRSGNAIRLIGEDGRERLYQSLRFQPLRPGA